MNPALANAVSLNNVNLTSSKNSSCTVAACERFVQGIGKLICLLMLILTTAVVFASEVYVWTDESGKKHFSDKPPEVTVGSDVEIKREVYEARNLDSAYPPTDPNASAQHRQQVKREREEKREVAQARAEQMVDKCKSARRRLKILSGPVTFVDPDGRDFEMTEAERRKLEQQLRQAIAQNCE